MQVIKGGRSSAGPRLSLVIALIALLAAAAAISVAVIGSKPSNQLVVTPTASPTAAATAGAPTSSPGGSIAVSGTPAPSGAPLPAELIGAWYSPPGFAWFIRAGDPACVALARTQLGCSIWTGTAVDRVPYTFATTTIVGGQLTLHWLNGYCSLITSRYAYALSGDSLVLTELPGGCNGGNLTLTRAGTGSAPSAPPQPSPAP